MSGHIFYEISLLLSLGAAVAFIMRLLRQPLIIGHILTGVIAGPALLDILHQEAAFSGLSNVGVALLLFIVGIDLNIRVFSRLSKAVFLTTASLVTIISGIGYMTARLLEFGRLESAVIGVGLSLSSTIIIVKLLNDKKETTRLYAQIAIGVLIVQDVIATAAKIGLAAKHEQGTSLDIALLVGRGIGVTLLLFIVSRYLIPRFTKTLESSRELLLIFALGWALGIATVFEQVGFSIEIGALFAGVSLAGLPYAREMASRLKPLRDFFLVIFFITLGQQLVPSQLSGIIVNALIFSAVVLLAKPLIVMASMGLLGYTKRASFKTALALSQVSEFSLVLIAAAVSAHLLSQEAAVTFTLVALITFGLSTYLMKYDDQLFSLIENRLRFFERKVTRLEQREASHNYPIVLFGYRKGGMEFLKTFNNMNKKFIVVDYDPEIIENLERQGTHYLYGDAVDPELLDELHLDKSKLVISTISDYKTNLFLSNWLAEHNPSAVFVCSADSANHAAELYDIGAAYVMIPHYIGSEKLSAFIRKNGFSKTEFKKYREKHLAYIQAYANSDTVN